MFVMNDFWPYFHHHWQRQSIFTSFPVAATLIITLTATVSLAPIVLLNKKSFNGVGLKISTIYSDRCFREHCFGAQGIPHIFSAWSQSIPCKYRSLIAYIVTTYQVSINSAYCKLESLGALIFWYLFGVVFTWGQSRLTMMDIGTEKSVGDHEQEDGVDNSNLQETISDKDMTSSSHKDKLTLSENSKLLNQPAAADDYEPELPSPSRQRVMLAVLLSLQFLALSIDTLIVPFFPTLAETKGLNSIHNGIIFSGYEFVRFLTSPIYGSMVSFFFRH